MRSVLSRALSLLKTFGPPTALLLALTFLAGQPTPHVVSTPPLTPQEEVKKFHLPAGFEAQLVAAEPDIHKPLNMAFDDQGRLWVTDTVEYPFPAPPDRKARDTVKVLSDFGPDGRARKVMTFADGLNIPIGVLPLPAQKQTEALVFSIPNIYRLRDTKGTGQADQRDVLYSRYEFKDTHGMTNSFVMGFDGWIYACHGFSNNSTVKGADGQPITMSSGNTYRMKPDGAHLEYFTHGQVNPFGLGFDPLGNLYSADCHSRPIYQLLRGAWYPSFGKPHDGLGFGPEIMTHDHGSTAIAGVVYYAADHFPPEYRDTIFIGNVVTNRINHDRLQRTGSTVKAVGLPDFLSSDDPWFRPVDIKLGPDGALYVADFYNRIIGHYEVDLKHPGRDRERGRIWRIVYKGKDGQNQPKTPRQDWSKATVKELIEDLGHPNLTVRLTATHQLAGREGAAPALRQLFEEGATGDSEKKAWQRAHALWALERAKHLEEPTLLASCQDASVLVRVHAQRILAERPSLSPALFQAGWAALKDADANVQRAAADALGRHPAAANIRPLLDLHHKVPAGDTHLLHVVRMALRDQMRVPAHWNKLPQEGWSEADARALADVALGVPSAEAAGYLLKELREHPARVNVLAAVQHVARHGSPETTAGLLPFLSEHQPGNPLLQANLFKSVDRGIQERGGQLDEGTRAWAVQLSLRLLASANKPEVLAGIEMVGRLRLEPQRDSLATLARNQAAAEDVRRAALEALAAIDLRRNAGVLGQVLLDPEVPLGLREQTAAILGRGNQPETLAELAQALPVVPARLQAAIAANLAGSKTGAEKLLDLVAAGKASARLLQERPVEVKLNQSQTPDLKTRIDKLTRGLPPAEQRIQELLLRRRKGFETARPDPGLGQKVFEKHCAACHQIANKGARIGPQLDGIGVRGLDRLLEDTLDPNRNVDQAFRTTNLTLKNGQTVSGLVLKEEGAVLVLADQMGKEVRVPKDSVEERSTSQLSPMPANLVDQVPEAEFYHLMAYLLNQRATGPR